MRKLLTLQIVYTILALNCFAGDAERGKKLFSQRSCNLCHAMGSEGSAATGPNLAGVTTKQPLEWVKRWIKNPDKMSTDPTVVELKKKYPTPMPNLGLSDAEVEDLVAYLKSVDSKAVR